MLPTILAVVAILIIASIVVVALQPADYRVTRSATIDAPPAVAFDRVNDFHNWEAWSPWAKLDPNAKNSFEGPPAGRDAVFAWSGNKKVGEGRMTIIDSRPTELVRIRLEFIRPFPSTATAEFNFQGEANNQTRVTWSMTGHKNFMSKAFCMFVNMDKMIGGDFQRGLSQMKAVVETKL